MPETVLLVNGRREALTVDTDTPLLWVLRDTLGLVGTKFGCGGGFCGACTVHVDGVATRACTLPLATVAGRAVVTIEGLGHPVQRAWAELDVAQCGYCQAGQLMTAAALLARTPAPTDDEIVAGMNGNLCRCGTYMRIRAAVRRAAMLAAANGAAAAHAEGAR
jgi:isoquinoline 1-oxidoreductase alpha subunit